MPELISTGCITSRTPTGFGSQQTYVKKTIAENYRELPGDFVYNL
jgi:hypothetical protein